MAYHLALMRYLSSLFIFVFLCIPAALQAQSRSFDCLAGKVLSAAKGKETVQNVQDAYSRVRSLTASFSQESFVSALEVSEMSTGTVWFSKPGKMKWLYLSPEEQTFLVQDETLWFYQKSENQLVIDEFRDMLISDLPVAFLMGIGNLGKDFKLLTACDGSDGVVLEFAPLGQPSGAARGSGLKSFKLLVSSDFFPRGARVSDVGGNTTSIILSGVSLNPDLPGETFAADFPKGGDINDRRKERGA